MTAAVRKSGISAPETAAKTDFRILRRSRASATLSIFPPKNPNCLAVFSADFSSSAPTQSRSRSGAAFSSSRTASESVGQPAATSAALAIARGGGGGISKSRNLPESAQARPSASKSAAAADAYARASAPSGAPIAAKSPSESANRIISSRIECTAPCSPAGRRLSRILKKTSTKGLHKKFFRG